jgi:phosphoglycerol transferase MdoB-like AlkP superfamily enzyme
MKKNIQLQLSSIVIYLIIYFCYIILLFERLIFDINDFTLKNSFLIFSNQFSLIVFASLVVFFNEYFYRNKTIINFSLIPILVINTMLLVVDHIFFKIIHTPLHLSFSEGGEISDFELFLGSGLSELSISNGLSFIVLFIGIGVIIKYLQSDKTFSFNIKFLAIPFCILISSLILPFFKFEQGLSQYPSIRLLGDIIKLENKETLSNTDDYKHEEIESLIYGKGILKKDDKLEKYQTSFLGKRKNIILFVIESVGSIQIAPNGKINPNITPNLYKYNKSITLFKNLYNIFPGTTRSHIPITTGGASMTWSSVNRELLYKYQGATMPSIFNRRDYHTALFSGMNLGFENLNFFYKNINFKYVFDPDDESSDFRQKHKVHSWGVDESIVFDKAAKWMSKNKGSSYLQILTNTTHHPYGIPKGFKSPLPGTTKYERYLQSLHYTDYRLGLFIEKLKSMKKLNNTLIFITGDHGQAFAKRHTGNWTHKNFLYDENIKNFLLVLDPTKYDKFTSVDIKGSIGDILPTISHFVSNEKIQVIGQNLFSNHYKQKLIFFHKNSNPELWGVIDGDYKFIASRMNEQTPELYNLKTDEKENINIILDHKEKIPIYTKKIKAWYLKLNNSFTSQLKNFKERPALTVEDLSSYGPKKISVGVNLLGEPFKELLKIHPDEDMSIWTQGVSYPVNTKLYYEFVSPSGKKKTFDFTYKKGWSSVKVYHKASSSMEEGLWKINIYLKNKKIITSEYNVSKKAKLHLDLFNKTGKINYISFGSRKNDNQFIQLDKINPNEDMEVQMLLSKFPKQKKLVFKWISPLKKEKSFHFTIKKGWTKSWVYHSSKQKMIEGEWTLVISHQKKELIRKAFTVEKGALLLKPDIY